MLIDRISQLAVKGRHIAAVPNRHTLVITGSEDIAGIRRVAETCLRAEGQPRFMSGHVLRLSDDGWESWLPPEGNFYHPTFLGLRARCAAADYAEQVKWLEGKGGSSTGAIRASFMVNLRNCKSVSTLGKQACPTSLPKTDLVALGDMEHADFVLGLCDWGAFAAAMGDGLRNEGCWPERHLVSEFPTPEQLSAMKLRNFETELGPLSDEPTGASR
jgi:hypothetical protein